MFPVGCIHRAEVAPRIAPAAVPRFGPDPLIQTSSRVIKVSVIADQCAIDPPADDAVSRRVGSARFNVRFNTRPRPT